MAGITSRFQNFISNIQLNDAELKDAITKHTGVRRTLHNAYYTTSFIKADSQSYALNIGELIPANEYIRAYKASDILIDDSTIYRTSLLVGSYGKNTEVAPPSDIDILFEMPSDLYDKYEAYTHNGQSKLLQDVKAVLLKTYPRTDIKGDGPIVSVGFQSYKIEVLPAFRLKTGGYYYPDTHNGGSWKKTYPRESKEHLMDKRKQMHIE